MNERLIAAKRASQTLIVAMAIALATGLLLWKEAAPPISPTGLSHTATSVVAQFKSVGRFSAHKAALRPVFSSQTSVSDIRVVNPKAVNQQKTEILEKAIKSPTPSEKMMLSERKKIMEQQNGVLSHEKGVGNAIDETVSVGQNGAGAGKLADGASMPRATREGQSDLLASVIAAIKADIERNKTYPRRARQTGIEGTVILRIHIGEDGRVASVTLGKADRFALLNQAALLAAKGLTRMQTELKRALTVEVPVVFSLQKDD